jgi:pseudouridine kinase
MPSLDLPRIACLGGAVIDRKLVALRAIEAGTSNPARGHVGFGGVARNVAENLARLGCRASLHSCVGDDANGAALLAHLALAGVDASAVRAVSGASTAEYVAILEPGGALHVAAADMAILDGLYGPLVDGFLDDAAGADWAFADCNAPAATLERLVDRTRSAGVNLAVDVISTVKAARLPHDLSGLGCLFLNRDEAAAILGGPAAPAELAEALKARGAQRFVLTLGADGAIAHEAGASHTIKAESARIVDVTGAGDAMIAGTLLGLASSLSLPEAARLGAHVAARAVASPLSVDETLAPAVAAAFLARASRSLRA